MVRCVRVLMGSALALSVSLAGTFGCGSSDGEGGSVCGGGEAYDAGIPDMPAVDPMDEATFVDLYVSTFCDALETCCQSAQVPFGRVGCEQAAAQEAASLRGPSASEFDPQAGADCISGLTWFGQVCPTTGAITILGPGITCGGVYHGEVEPGSVCASRSECKAPEGGASLCMPVSYPGPDVCITLVQDRGPGDSCTTAYDDVFERHNCMDGYDCNDDTGFCETDCRGGLGADCSEQYCAIGLTCDPANTCVPQKSPGEPCDSSQECFGTCREGVCSHGLDEEACYAGT